MESFLLYCNGSLVILAVVLMILDDRRRPGAPPRSPFRISELVRVREVKRREPYQRPAPIRRKRRP